MPYVSDKQRRWAHTKEGKEALGPETVEEFDKASKGKDLPEEAKAGKGPTRTQGPGKASDTVRTMRKVSREQNMGGPSGGPQGTKKGKKGYTRKEKHKGADLAQSTKLTEIDETYRHMNFPMSSLDWDRAVEARPCGEEEAYPEKCGEGGGDKKGGSGDYRSTDVPESPRPKQTGNPSRPLNDYDKKWYDVDYYLGSAEKFSDLKNRAKKLNLHGPDTEKLIDDLVAKQVPSYEGQEAIQEHYMNKWEKMNPDPYKGGGEQEEILLEDEAPEEITLDDEYIPNDKLIDHIESPSERKAPEDKYGREKNVDWYDKTTLHGSKIAADLSWSTHKAETFEDTGEKGEHPAWGFKSIIDRGVKPHEKPSGDKNINPDNQTQKRKGQRKNFKAFSHVLSWE